MTVLAPTAAEADALSTAFYLLGPEAAGDLCRAHPEIGVVIVEEGPADRSPRVLDLRIEREDFLIDGSALRLDDVSVKNLRAQGTRRRIRLPGRVRCLDRPSRTDHHAQLLDSPGISSSRNYPGFLGGTLHRLAPDRHRLAFSVRRG